MPHPGRAKPNGRNPALARIAVWLARQLERPPIRTLAEFAVDELRIPSGEFAGRRFRFEPQPLFRLLFAAIDSGNWSRVVVLGTVQSGKTYCGYVIPVLYHLFELREDVICGVPNLDMAADKWSKDLLPAIEATRYADYLPVRGQGSKGGTSNLREIRFQNGASLRFMSGQGGDEKRSGYTSRVIAVTEVDKIDRAAESSREADPITQMENRAAHWSAARRRIFLECTVSIETGRIWQEYEESTKSKIVCQCGECGGWVTPEREDLHGWREAADPLKAGRNAYFACPLCAAPITERERRRMNAAAKLLHEGQDIDPDGRITGEPKETRTLGFRWNAFNNLFVPTSDVAEKEWTTARYAEEGDPRAEAAEREARQFRWTIPWEPPEIEATLITRETVEKAAERIVRPRGLCPRDTVAVTVGVDLGKWRGHWAALAWRKDGGPHITDYGTFKIPSDKHPTKKATLIALRQFRDRIRAGFPVEGAVEPRTVDQTWIDSGWFDNKDGVYEFCRESAAADGVEPFRPAKGYGATQPRPSIYTAPAKKSHIVRVLGEEYHISRVGPRLHLCHVNADYWKGRVHQQLAAEEAGTTIFTSGDADAHKAFANHLTAEGPAPKETRDRGIVTVWTKKRDNNHWLDATALATVAAHMAGVRLTRRHETAGEKPAAERGWFERAIKKG